MLKRASDEPHANALSKMVDVLEDAENNGLISPTQSRALLKKVAVNLSPS